MYKTRNSGTGNGMRETWEMGEMLYSGKCRQTLRGMSSDILENVLTIIWIVWGNLFLPKITRKETPKSALTFSKLTIETLEQGVKYVQS